MHSNSWRGWRRSLGTIGPGQPERWLRVRFSPGEAHRNLRLQRDLDPPGVARITGMGRFNRLLEHDAVRGDPVRDPHIPALAVMHRAQVFMGPFRDSLP